MREPAAEPSVQPRPASRAPTTLKPSGPLVLVIDDDATVRDLVFRSLTKEGFQVVAAVGGEQGLELARKFKPAVITLDVMMPGMDGIELCRVVRERADTQNTPVLILSARGDAESIMRGIEAGANDYLPKPILHHDLVAKVRVMLEQVDGAA